MSQGMVVGVERWFEGSTQEKITSARTKSCKQRHESEPSDAHRAQGAQGDKCDTYTDELVERDVAEVRAGRDVEPEDPARPGGREHERVVLARSL